MKQELLTDRYKEKISGVLGCFDRLIIQGDLSRINYPKGMEWHLYKNDIKIFDYTKFAQSFRDKLKEQVAAIAQSHGLKFIEGRRRGIKKEDIAAAEFEKKKQKDGEVKGLFCIIQAMESCPSFKPLYNNEKNNKIPSLYYMVEKKDGTTCKKFTSMKKYIYSMEALIGIMKASNRRYLEFISTIEDKRLGCKRLEKVTKRVEEKKRGYRGINFFAQDDIKVIKTVSRGEFIIYGFRNKDIKSFMPGKSSGQISRLLKRLRLHGLIRKAGKSYKYYLTTLGKQVLITAMKIRELIIIPALNY